MPARLESASPALVRYRVEFARMMGNETRPTPDRPGFYQQTPRLHPKPVQSPPSLFDGLYNAVNGICASALPPDCQHQQAPVTLPPRTTDC